MTNPQMNTTRVKSYSDCYLYHANNLSYEKNIINFIMTADEIDKTDESFDDIRYEIKRRQVSNSLLKVLDSNNVKLMKYSKPLPKAFKVFCAKDVRGDKKNKVFIDCDVLQFVDGRYVCTNVDIFISYLMSAMTSLIYFADPKRLLMQDTIIKSGTSAFAGLFTNIIDYLYKISTVPGLKDKCIYLASVYFQVNILGRDLTEGAKALARREAGISEREEQLILMRVNLDEDFENIKEFIECVSKVLNLSKLTLDVFLEKWIFLYAPGTQFALELYPAFSTMLTNVYIGSYLNNQKTIEKITGKDVVLFTGALLRVGSEIAK